MPPCRTKVRAERGQVGNLRNVQPDILRQHVGEAGQNLFRLPALALEIDDVRLHEDGAAVAKHRHGLGAERQIGVVGHIVAETRAGGLQEVSVAGRALRVELEILYAAVLQDDELDVLAAHVADDVGMRDRSAARLGVRHGLDDGRVGIEHVLQNVLGVAGGAHAENLERGALLFDLLRAGCRTCPCVSSMGLPLESW